MRYVVACVCGVLISAVAFVGIASSQGEGDSRDGRRSILDVLKVGDPILVWGQNQDQLRVVSESRVEELKGRNRSYKAVQAELQELNRLRDSGQLTQEEHTRRTTELLKDSPRSIYRIDRIVEIGADFVAYREDDAGEESDVIYLPYHRIAEIRLPGKPAPEGADKADVKQADE